MCFLKQNALKLRGKYIEIFRYIPGGKVYMFVLNFAIIGPNFGISVHNFGIFALNSGGKVYVFLAEYLPLLKLQQKHL